MSFERIVALLPMRHHSVRVPGKNYRLIAGKALYRHVLDTLLAVPEISEVVVDTDSPVVLEGLERDYPQVRRILRPEELRDGNIPMNRILLHDADQVPADLYLQTHTTNPLLKAQTIRDAIAAFRNKWPEYDSLFGVSRIQNRLWDHENKPINHNPNELLRTQDLPPVYWDNSCVYIFTAETLRQRGNRLGFRPQMFEIDGREAVDIDEELDFEIAEILLEHQNRGKPSE
jgi:CMP-N-acetylneuraminic acid synthetase